LRVRVTGAELSGEVRAPPSKSYTHRAVTAALLSEGYSTVLNPLRSRDTEATINSARLFGAAVEEDEDRLVVRGRSRPLTPINVIDADELLGRP